jgi:hypothetical protein
MSRTFHSSGLRLSAQQDTRDAEAQAKKNFFHTLHTIISLHVQTAEPSVKSESIMTPKPFFG